MIISVDSEKSIWQILIPFIIKTLTKVGIKIKLSQPDKDLMLTWN